MKNALSDWQHLQSRIAGATFIDLFLDFDGTIAPIASTPSGVKLSEHARKILTSLRKTGTCRIGIISGRMLSEIMKMVDLRGLYYAGNHGFEIRGPKLNFTYKLTKDQQTSFESILTNLKKSLGSIAGVIIEDKLYTLSIHYRLVHCSKVKHVREVVEDCVKAHPNVKLSKGKMVLEVRPQVEWNKGDAVEVIRKNFEVRGLPIYIGDDITDEDAFRRLKDGITVRVGMNENSAAKYFVSSNEVNELLERIYQSL